MFGVWLRWTAHMGNIIKIRSLQAHDEVWIIQASPYGGVLFIIQLSNWMAELGHGLGHGSFIMSEPWDRLSQKDININITIITFLLLRGEDTFWSSERVRGK